MVPLEQTSSSSPRSVVTIDLGAVRNNVRFLKGKTQPGTRFLAVVKADSYGHGILACTRVTTEAGADGVAVVTAEEAVCLRDAGFEGRILVMGPLYGSDQYVEMASRDVEFAIVSDEMARIVQEVGSTGPKARIHLKVDTGMNRQGLLPQEARSFLGDIRGHSRIDLVGVMTHFASAAEDPSSIDFQLRRFLPLLQLAKADWPKALAHAANSAATMGYPHTHLDMVRCGIAVYGLSPSQGDSCAEGLTPALSWASQVALVKRVPAGEGVGYGLTFRPSADTHVALVPVGYADGVFRLLGNRGHVLIGGRRYPMVGRVSMDSFGVDVGNEGRVRTGDQVTLIGQDMDSRLGAEDLASWAETINYEITCNIGLDRAQRVFINDSQS